MSIRQSAQGVSSVTTTNTAITDILVALKNIFNAIARPMWVDPTTADVKVKLTSGTVTTVTTVTAVTTVTTLTTATTLTNLGTANVTGIYLDRNTWANWVRPRIT